MPYVSDIEEQVLSKKISYFKERNYAKFTSSYKNAAIKLIINVVEGQLIVIEAKFLLSSVLTSQEEGRRNTTISLRKS